MFERLYSSRIDRIGFFLGSLYLVLPIIGVIIAYALLNFAMGTSSFGETNPLRTTVNISLFLIGAASIILLPFVSVGLYIRRLHDMNQTGWLCILAFIPFVNWFVWLVLQFYPGTVGDNVYGTPRSPRGFVDVLFGSDAPVQQSTQQQADTPAPIVGSNDQPQL